MAITSQMIYARLAMEMLQNQQSEALAAAEQVERREKEKEVS